MQSGNGEFDPTPFIGTLENEGVGLAPFHDWADRVPADLDTKVQALADKIKSGEVTVESYLAG